MIIVDIKNQHCSASISLLGGQVVAWEPMDQQPVIWLSEKAIFNQGKAIRGGIPVCWPWFGAHSNDASQPAHGFVRTQNWELLTINNLENGSTDIQLNFPYQASPVWKHQYELSLQILAGETLELSLQTRNTGSESFSITEALHTYFQISDIQFVDVTGLDSLDYLDKVQDYQQFSQQGAVAVEEEIDRIYINHSGDCVIDDSKWQRRIHISKQNSLSTVVWNPGEQKSHDMADMNSDGYKNMLCVETANTNTHEVSIEAGESHTMMATYHIENY